MNKFKLVTSLSLVAAVVGGLTAVQPASAECSSSKNKASAATPAKKDIVEVAQSAGSFNTLVAALKAADLVGVLKGEGPFTVFAPTDEAFKKIPQADLNALLKDKKKLTKILTYHVVPGDVKAKDVVKLKDAKTVEGSKVPISANDKGVKVGGASVVKADINCSNGVVHVIDTVITPPTI